MTCDLDSRFECKYRLDPFTYLQIRNALYPYMKKDSFTEKALSRGYVVRSLYFDTDDYQSYYEKMNGDSERVKFRLRTYPSNPQTAVRVELKMRKASLVIKKVALVSWAQYDHFMRTWHWEVENPVLQEFSRILHARQLRPKVMIEYQREGFTTRVPSDLRVTFDHALKSVEAKSLTGAPPFFRKHDPHSVVMEIKFQKPFPAWLKTIVQQYGLKMIANSKYAQAIQVSTHRFYHPDHVIVTR